MLIYNDNDDIAIVQSVASASTLISSATTAARDYIVSNFPDNFFQHIYVDSSEMITQSKINQKYNNILDKIPYPSLAIVPEFSLDDPIPGMQKSLHLNSPNLFLRKDMRAVYKTLLVDPYDKIQIFYTSDYITIPFQFKITVNTFMNNADVAYYLKSKFQKDTFRYLPSQILSTEIPKSFIKCIANLKGWDITKSSDMNKLRLFMIGADKRENRIDKRVNLATGKQCFFINELVDFLTSFGDLDASATVIKTDQIEGEYQITFRFQISTHLPNAFIMKINRSIFEKLPQSVQDSLTSESDQQDAGFFETSIINGNLTASGKQLAVGQEAINFKDSLGKEWIGQRVFKEVFRHNMSEPIADIDLMDSISADFKKAHAMITSDILKGFDLSSLVYATVHSSKGIVDPTKYEFDPRTMIIKFDPTFVQVSDLVVQIYLNRVGFEALIEAAKIKKNYWNGNFLGTIIGMVNNKRVRFIVRSFENSTQEYGVDINKSFRVQTNYGTGYVHLKEINDDKKDLYRLCVGYDKENRPIIKTFEVGK